MNTLELTKPGTVTGEGRLIITFWDKMMAKRVKLGHTDFDADPVFYDALAQTEAEYGAFDYDVVERLYEVTVGVVRNIGNNVIGVDKQS